MDELIDLKECSFSELAQRRQIALDDDNIADWYLIEAELAIRNKKVQNIPTSTTTSPAKALCDADFMPFGKYKGQFMKDIPSSYLDWLIGQEFCEHDYPEVAAYIMANKKDIERDISDD